MLPLGLPMARRARGLLTKGSVLWLLDRGDGPTMVWFLERASETLICEVRQADDGDEFELAVRAPGQPEHVERFAEPTVLIETLVHRQQQLHRDGWRPRS